MYLALEIMLLAAALAALWRFRSSFIWQKPEIHMGISEWLLLAALAIALFFFAYRFLLQIAENPLGGWDAWTLWNYRARYLLQGDASSWRNVFTVNINHSDYPYLLTGFIARCWVLIGKDRTIVPVITSILFTISTVGLLIAVLAELRGLASGLLGGFLLVSLPIFLWTTASQYADLPVAFYLLSALVFVYWFILQDQDPLALAAAGGMASFSLWAKNEGVSIVVALAAAVLVYCLLNRVPWAMRLRRLAFFAAGLIPVAVLFLCYKTWLVPPTDLFEDRQTADLLRQALDPARFKIIASIIWGMFDDWGSWKAPYLICLGVYAVVAGVRRLNACEKMGIAVLSAVVVMTYIQYMGIYLITPHDLAWHLSTSIGRLYNQLQPAFLLIFFLLVRNTDDLKY